MSSVNILKEPFMFDEDRNLRILQVNTADQGGGAEGSAWNLFKAYARYGHDSWLAVGYKHSSDPNVLLIPNDKYRSQWARACLSISDPIKSLADRASLAERIYMGSRVTALRWIGEPDRFFDLIRGNEDFNFPGTEYLLEITPKKPDIIHCHNLHGGYFDLRFLPKLSKIVPIILNLRDAWLLSGHCAHSFECDRWKTGCGSCPYLRTPPPIIRDGTAFNWLRKSKIYADSQLYITAPSHWMINKVKDSMLQGIAYKVIPNGIDLTIFHPSDQLIARKDLNLPASSKIILAVGFNTKVNPFKDYITMERSVRLASERNPNEEIIFICIGGKGKEKQLNKCNVRFINFIKEPKLLAKYYQASDICIHAAKAEVFGKAVTEALACGKPVVATNVGGIPEQVNEDITGFLVRLGDIDAMASRIEKLLWDDDLRAKMGSLAVKDVQNRFNIERQANDFLRWYCEILDDFRHTDVGNQGG